MLLRNMRVLLATAALALLLPLASGQGTYGGPTPTPTPTPAPVQPSQGFVSFFSFFVAVYRFDQIIVIQFVYVFFPVRYPFAFAVKRRNLLQVPGTFNARQDLYTTNFDVQNGAGAFQTFPVRLDTGSCNLLVQNSAKTGGFAAGPLVAVNTGVDVGFAPGASEYQTTFRFQGIDGRNNGANTTTKGTNVFAADRPGSNAFNTFPAGLCFSGGLTVGGAQQSPFLRTMASTGVINIPGFTLVLTYPFVVAKGIAAPTSQIGLGNTNPDSPALLNVEQQCAPATQLLGYFGGASNSPDWHISLQRVSATPGTPALGANNVATCGPNTGCVAAVDSGFWSIGAPSSFIANVLTLLGVAAGGPLVGPSITGRTSLGNGGNGFPRVPCTLRLQQTPTLDFQIQDRVYSLRPPEYINEFRQDANGNAIGSTCFLNIDDTTSYNVLTLPGGAAITPFVLGAPFLALYPSLFLGAGVIKTTTEPRGVPRSASAPAIGANGTPQQNVCLFGTVPVKAVCADPITLAVTDPATCTASIGSANLIDQISLANRVSGFSIAGADPLHNSLGPSKTVFSVAAAGNAAGATTLTFKAGPTALALTATTAVPSTDTCTTSVTVPIVPPVAKCQAAVTLPATAGCKAVPTTAQLLAAIDAGSTGGSGLLTRTLAPAAAAADTYGLSLGTSTFTLTLTNCAGTSTCTSQVTVADQEALDPTKVQCNAPADGALETPLLSLNKNQPAATYVPTYAKANGCPVTVTNQNLRCQNCLLGKPDTQSRCEAAITAAGVAIYPDRTGRVRWTTSVADGTPTAITKDCAVCVDHGPHVVTTLGHCVKPFTADTPCSVGNL